MKKFAIVVFCLFTLTLVYAQEQQQDQQQRIESISIRECLLRSLRYNLDIEVEKYNPPIAEADIEIAKSVFDPVFNANATHSNTTTARVQQFNIGGIVIQDTFVNKTESTNFDVGIDKRHQYGGSIGIFYNFDYRKSDFDGDGNQSVIGHEAEIRITQSLLKNFGVDVNTANINIAENNYENAQYAYGAKILKVLADVQQAYFDLVNAQENLQLQRQSLKLSENLYKITQARIKAGSLAAADILDAERDLAAKNDLLIVAEKNVLDAEDFLKRLIRPLDVEYYKDIRFIPTDRPAYSQIDIDFDEVLKYAFDNRADLKQSLNNLKSADIDITVQKNQLLPSLDLIGTFGVQGEANENDAALELIEDYEAPRWAIQLSLEIPLGNRAARSNYRKAMLTKQQLVSQHRNIESVVILEIRTAIRALETASRRVHTARKTRELAEKQLANEENKYRAGIIALFQVQNTEQNLTEARINEVNALIDFHKAIVELERAQWAMNAWLQRYQIKLPPEIYCGAIHGLPR